MWSTVPRDPLLSPAKHQTAQHPVLRPFCLQLYPSQLLPNRSRWKATALKTVPGNIHKRVQPLRYVHRKIWLWFREQNLLPIKEPWYFRIYCHWLSRWSSVIYIINLISMPKWLRNKPQLWGSLLSSCRMAGPAFFRLLHSVLNGQISPGHAVVT